MRPGRYRPGCGAPIRPDILLEGGFNEAGAISPRMPALVARNASRLISFNEAGAISPRMLRLRRRARASSAALQ